MLVSKAIEIGAVPLKWPWNYSKENSARASCSNAGKPALAVSDHGGFAAMKRREIGTLKF